ncbi:hypothetical protein M8J76_004978 [Diaphorina citri]|nr:hypothetical protein M8J76_004978 [Diaphorina citri]
MYNMKPTVTVPTRIQSTAATCLDNIFVNFSPNHILNPNSNIFSGIGDHKHAQIISFTIQKIDDSESMFVRSYTSKKVDLFFRALSEVDFNPIKSYSSDVNYQLSLFYDIFLSVFNLHFPLKSISFKNRKRKEWITKGIMISCAKKRSLFNLTLHSDDPSLILYYQSYCKILHKTIKAGVPQGSVLGPLLFLLFINDITSADPSAFLTLFADDTTVLVSSLDRDSVFRRSAEVMSKIQTWFQTNKQ